MSTDESSASGTGDLPYDVHPHPRPEGEYEEKDVSDVPADEPVGEYPDTDVVEPRPPVPDDVGSFPDQDVVSEHRQPLAEGSFEDADVPGQDQDVEAVQIERAHLDHASETHDSETGPAAAPADPT